MRYQGDEMMDRRLKQILNAQNMMTKRKVFYISSATVALLATGICSPQVIQADQTATTESTQVQTEQSEVQKVEENSKVETSQVDVESTTDSERSENTTIGATSKETEAAQTTELTAQEDTEKTLMNVESETEPVQKEETKQLVERKHGNDWYLIDKETGEKATGFQRLEEQAKTVYYNNEGKMQYGWQWVNNATHYFDTFNGAMAIGEKNINGHWYLFNEQGQMQRGFQTLENSDEKKTVYYNKDGWMLYGWQWVNNATHYFDMFNGAMATGEKNINGHWYLFDRQGQMQRGFQELDQYGQNKTVYYNDQGHMLYGQQRIANKWYNFDTFDGAMKTGFQYIAGQNKWVYYAVDGNNRGQMQYGFQNIAGKTYYFDTFNGAQSKNKQQNINGNWYLFDEAGIMQTGFQNLTRYGQNKVVYYAPNGQMQYGYQTIAGKRYYFDTFDGAMKRNALVFDKDNKVLIYFTGDGSAAQGVNVLIEGKMYGFTEEGALINAPGEAKIAGKWYLFGDNDQLLTGMQILSDKRQVYYDLETAQMKYGQLNLAGKWYLFDKINGAMQTGFKDLKEYGQNKTVYYNKQGQMQYGQQLIAGHWYLFDTFDGAMKTGLQWIKDQAKFVYYASNGQMQYGTIQAGRITYYADQVTGSIDGVFNNAEVIGQNPELPTGCEITAVTMMLRYAGKNVNKIQLAHEMPKSNNGDYGFVGDPFSVTGWWVFPTGVAPVVNKYMGTSKVMTGASWSDIYRQLLNGRLVVVWMANMNGFVNHAITLTGYRKGVIYYNNPWTAKKESMTADQFYKHWNANRQRALSY